MSEERKEIESLRRRLKETNRGNPSAVSDCSSKRDDTGSMPRTNRGHKPEDESGLTTSVGMSKEEKRIVRERFKKTSYGNDSLLDSSVRPSLVAETPAKGKSGLTTQERVSLPPRVMSEEKNDDIESMFETNCGKKPRSSLAATPFIPEPVVPKEQKPFFYWIEQWKKREKQRESENKNNVR